MESLKKPTPNSGCMADHYDSVIKTALDKLAPLSTKTITIKPKAPWFTPDLSAARRIMRKAERQLKSHGREILTNRFSKSKGRNTTTFSNNPEWNTTKIRFKKHTLKDSLRFVRN
ncbi:hypothetical protein SNE40_014303 [Patella caerulea]|uniref:Uncharacterized protein n=1 Tax=Patella caerulea TaxID=87958 RepID=A0AAN8JKW5_PATCE